MAILKNTTIDDTGFITIPSGTIAQRPSPPSTGMFRYNTELKTNEYYDGTRWLPGLDGLTSQTAALSAQEILRYYPNSPDGVYWIDLPVVGPTQVYCIMNSVYDGGGWMMAMKATRGTTFNYNANYWTTANTLNPTQTNRNDGDAKFNSMNYFSSKDMMAVFPDISNGGSISGSTIGWTWLQNDFYAGTRIVPITLWSTVDRYFIRDAKTFNGWASGVFSSQVDVRFYGFNYRNNPGVARTRWGFGWNENGGGLYPNGNMDSDDVFGGIGLLRNNFSAGDSISCCQDTTGINRSARVEVYVR
jgi:hypothetical protein